MKAFVMHGYGGPDHTRLEEVEAPAPGPEELLVRVVGAGLNPVDYKIREGKLRGVVSLPSPAILGNELSGEVVAVGAQVKGFAPGDRILSRVDKGRMGAFAELACVGASTAAPAPTSIPLVDAAGLPLAGLTALQALRMLEAGPGRHLLITGGAGGVGTLAIGIAKHLGATVTTTASPRGRDLVLGLGADAVIDYTTTDLTTVSERFDGVFDLIGGDTLSACFGLARPGSTVVSVAGMPEPRTAREDLNRGPALQALFWVGSMGVRRQAAQHDVTYRFLFMQPDGAALAELVTWLDQGALRLIIDRRYPFAEIGQAMAVLEEGRAKGKIVVEMG
ncbi:MAG: NADP-dependent oxidoreductase [Alphaproteobacteria bacterium]|nr:NADP-dependent oxidoreductase [Alphaproteobacteria bacterium]